jgi:hypothetical protein
MKMGKEHEYWHAAWMVDGKTRSVHLGSCMKLGQEEALQKARRREEMEMKKNLSCMLRAEFSIPAVS